MYMCGLGLVASWHSLFTWSQPTPSTFQIGVSWIILVVTNQKNTQYVLSLSLDVPNLLMKLLSNT